MMFARQEEETSIPLLERNVLDDEQEDCNRESDANEVEDAHRPRKTTPLPWTQIIVLSFTRLAEPIAYTQIFPVSSLC